MNAYEVVIGDTLQTVNADRFEIEAGGVLVFHESEDATGTIGEMTADTKIVAYNNWEEVERL